MKTSRKNFLRLAGVLAFSLILLSFPVCSLAAEESETVQVPDSATATVPDSSEISSNLDYSEGTTGINSIFTMSLASTSSSVSGGCSITKVSSSQVMIRGYSVTSPSNPALKVSLQLQAYYSGSWHTLVTTVKSVTGTRVELTKTYNVTSGYYYRVVAIHSLANGTSTTSRTGGILVE